MALGKTGVTTNRDCILRTLNAKGLPHISQLTLANVKDLLKIVKWNEANGIKFFRVSSGLFPWKTRYEFEELPDWLDIQKVLQDIGAYVTEVNQRLEFHPSHYTILASPNPKTVETSIKDLDQHSRIFDEMGLVPSHWNCINIHVGGAYGDKESATQRWCDNFQKLSETCQRRVVVENDDKANMYSVKDLHSMIWKKVRVPITFDIFHHTFCTGGMKAYNAAQLASTTWGKVPMVIHWSSSMKNYENPEAKSVAHAEYIYDTFEDWNTDGWFMCESKAKEKSILEYWESGPRPQMLLTKEESMKTMQSC